MLRACCALEITQDHQRDVPESKGPAQFPVLAFAKCLISLVVLGLEGSGVVKRKSVSLVGAAGFELATPCTPSTPCNFPSSRPVLEGTVIKSDLSFRNGTQCGAHRSEIHL
jgi:hypothetical protein